MIAQLTGRLLDKDLTRVVIDVNGIGFELLIPMSTFDRLPREGEQVTLKTWLHVREDALQLFGFQTDSERQLFLLVTGVQGIGPKLGLSVLSCMSVENFCAAVINSDVKALSRIQGIGKRSAERLTVELKGKIEAVAPAVALGGKPSEARLGAYAEDAIGALITLGFKADQARKTVRALIDDLPEEQRTTDNLIRQALAAKR